MRLFIQHVVRRQDDVVKGGSISVITLLTFGRDLYLGSIHDLCSGFYIVQTTSSSCIVNLDDRLIM
jgi:hypothetical protein